MVCISLENSSTMLGYSKKHRIFSSGLKEAFCCSSINIFNCRCPVNVADFIVFYSMPKLSYRAFRPFKILPGCRAFSHGSIQNIMTGQKILVWLKNSWPTRTNLERSISNSQRVDLYIARCNDIWACYPKNWITKIILATFFLTANKKRREF